MKKQSDSDRLVELLKQGIPWNEAVKQLKAEKEKVTV